MSACLFLVVMNPSKYMFVQLKILQLVQVSAPGECWVQVSAGGACWVQVNAAGAVWVQGVCSWSAFQVPQQL